MIYWLALYVVGGIVTAFVAWHEFAATDPGEVFPFPKWIKVLMVSLWWPGAAIAWLVHYCYVERSR